MKERENEELSRVIAGLTHVLSDWLTESRAQFQWMVTHHHFATKHDIHELQSELSMKLSDIRNAISTASRQQKEALQEIGSQIADLNKQIEDLKNSATDPDVTDEAFLADLDQLQKDAKALADIVPGSPTPSNPPTDGTGSVTGPGA